MSNLCHGSRHEKAFIFAARTTEKVKDLTEPRLLTPLFYCPHSVFDKDIFKTQQKRKYKDLHYNILLFNLQ